jgi:hypothetical protein
MKEYKILYIFGFQDIGEYIVVAKNLMQNTKLFLKQNGIVNSRNTAQLQYTVYICHVVYKGQCVN